MMMILTCEQAITGKARKARITVARSNHFPDWGRILNVRQVNLVAQTAIQEKDPLAA